MNNIDIANGMIFQKMKISKESFDDRLVCQKKIYLLQSLGVDLGYTYNWYIRGPYSPTLTDYIYNNLDILNSNDFEKYHLSEKAEQCIEKVNSLEDKKIQGMEIVSWYELLASLLYIYNNKISWKIDNQESSLFEVLMKYKPQYNKEQCCYAFSVLKEKDFVEAGVEHG